MTLSPHFTSQCRRIVAASLAEMIWAPLSRDSISSRTPGRNTVYSLPTTVSLSPSSRSLNLLPSMAPSDCALTIP